VHPAPRRLADDQEARAAADAEHRARFVGQRPLARAAALGFEGEDFSEKAVATAPL